ncbi:MAG TPA: hypothetical protein VLA76_10400 [Candidatus Angelobacter sp.]|nr:hypothetical protein [Candidatus Angelobacter sp.]
MRRKLTLAVAAAALAVTAIAGPVAAARPDVECQRAGITFLRENGLLAAVARDGLTIEAAVGAGVGVRDPENTDLSALPNPLPFSLILADHRAGSNSIFTYPWC